MELGPWYEPFTLNGLNTWEIAPHPVHTPRPAVAARRWEILSSVLPNDVAGLRILDVGCLEGYLATQMASIGAAVDAIDVWPAAIARATLVADVLKTGIKPRVADIYAVSGTYDLVVMSNVLPMLSDPLRALRRAAGLAPRLLVWCRLNTRPTEVLAEDEWYPSRDELANAISGVGYRQLAWGDSRDPDSALILASRMSEDHAPIAARIGLSYPGSGR